MSVRSFALADSDIPMADDPSEDTPLSAAFVAKRRLPVRCSPPIASEDDDISDLDSDEGTENFCHAGLSSLLGLNVEICKMYSALSFCLATCDPKRLPLGHFCTSDISSVAGKKTAVFCYVLDMPYGLN